jgi:hypothetical protein
MPTDNSAVDGIIPEEVGENFGPAAKLAFLNTAKNLL